MHILLWAAAKKHDNAGEREGPNPDDYHQGAWRRMLQDLGLEEAFDRLQQGTATSSSLRDTPLAYNVKYILGQKSSAKVCVAQRCSLTGSAEAHSIVGGIG